MVALLGLFEHDEVFVEHLLLRERDAVDARHLLALGVSAPECAGHARYLDGLDESGGHQVRTTAKVGEVALRVGGDGAVFQVLCNVLALVGLTVGLELLQRVGLRDISAHDGLVFLGQFEHLSLDFGEVVLRDHLSFGRHDVIEEAVLDGRSEAELNAGIKLLQGFGKQMRRRVPEGVLALFVLKLVECNRRVFVDGAVQFYGLTVNPARYNVAGESRRDALCDLQTGDALFIRANRPVRKSDFNHVTN